MTIEHSYTTTYSVKDLETVKRVNQLIDKEVDYILGQVWKEDPSYKCECDCGCKKPNESMDGQCDDCDNGTHYDDLNKVYVNYDDERLSD